MNIKANNMNLQNELQAYCEKHNVNMSKVYRGKQPNPFKDFCGNNNAYRLYRGKPVSKNVTANFFKFFTELKNEQPHD